MTEKASNEPSRFTGSDCVVEITMNDIQRNKKHGFPSNFIKTSKYTALTFLFVNLYHQFHKVSNVYFLCNAVVAVIPDVAPVSPFTAISPLVFVLGVAAIKDGYEDWLRHRADDRANSMPAFVVREASSGSDPAINEGKSYELLQVESKDIEVGDVMRIALGDEVRADVLLLSSTLPESSTFIETSNLDGETNLKNRIAVEPTWHLNTLEACVNSDVQIHTTPPDPRLLSWAGMITVDGKEAAVGIEQFLYRSCILRNTDHCWGVVVYTGVDTKMFKNMQQKPQKFSTLDEKLNSMIVLSIFIQLLCLILLSSLSVHWNRTHDTHWYIRWHLEEQSGAKTWIFRVLSYFILISWLIPISLFVTIELCKVAQAKFMEWDHGMFVSVGGRWIGCQPNTSDLNEQLAVVRYVFSDKTGTLTENVMQFAQGDILGLAVNAQNFEQSRRYLAGADGEDASIAAKNYFEALALCNTVQPFVEKKSTAGIVYEGSSPDEVALVKCAAEHSYRLVSRTTRRMDLEIFGNTEEYEILATLGFTPDRKMMSVVVRQPTGDIVMLTKGADSFVIPRLFRGQPNRAHIPHLKEALKHSALLGLRTLVVCRRPLTEAQYESWMPSFIEASKALANRSKLVDAVCLELERELLLVGATAVEDKLQEQVPETVKFFIDAGIVVWMLTGDKRETAVTIAATSSLCDPQTDTIVHIDVQDKLPESPEASDLVRMQLERAEAISKTSGRNLCFVIDGVALDVAMTSHFELFLRVSQVARSAVCCRLTPIQKANVVRMFQKATQSTALAIGDGANDASMIQEGRVGVGIIGLEGNQAALAADYAIPRFRHLRRLCMVHGRYSLVRNSLCVLFSFYKNILMASAQIFYAFSTGFSGTTLFEGWLLTFYNILFTSLPPFLCGVYEKDLDEKPLEEDPALYAELRDKHHLGSLAVLKWWGEAAVHSAIVFAVTYPTQVRLDCGPRLYGEMQTGTMIMFSVVFLALSKLALHVKYWIHFQFAGFAIACLIFLAYILIMASFVSFDEESVFYHSTYVLMSDPKLWFYALWFAVTLLLDVDWAIMTVQRMFWPTIRDRVQDTISRGTQKNPTEGIF